MRYGLLKPTPRMNGSLRTMGNCPPSKYGPFTPPERDYYGLERLWADAAIVPWADSATTAS